MTRTHGNVQKHESPNPIQRWLIGRFHERIIEFVRRAEPACILEIGCGEGYVLAQIQHAGIEAQLIGVDRSEQAIREARRRVTAPAALHVGDAHEVTRTYTGARPDLVMMLEVLEHLEDPEPVLAGLVTLTSRHVLLSAPRGPLFRGMNLLRLKNVRDLGNDPEHVNHWSANAFVDLVSRSFDVVAAARPFPWTMVLARVRTGDPAQTGEAVKAHGASRRITG